MHVARSIAVAVCLLGMAVTTGPRGRAAELPNVLLILADDLGYGDLGCFNATSEIPTPHLDRLADQGLRMTDAHSPCTVCTPTRYSLLTGQMAFRIPRGGRVFTGAGGPSLIAEGRLTLPQMLRSRGYATACVGKWHVGLTFHDAEGKPINEDGLEAVKRIDYSRRIDGGPLAVGFDSFFGTACCPTTDWLYAFIEGDRVVNAPTQQLDRSALPKHPYANDNRPGMVADDFDLERVDLTFLTRSQQFLRDHAASTPEKPFFLFHATQAVHLPSFPAPQFQGRSGKGPHGDFIVELDWIVGELMKTLEETGAADNTIVVFTSDNGPEVTSVVHMREDQGHDPARPWRGMKRDNWEGGHRVPFLVRWPGEIAAGASSDQLICLTDVMATLADVAGVSLPDEAAEDSASLLGVWRGEQQEPVHDYVIHQGFGGDRYLAIRQGDWKLLAHQGSGGNTYDRHPRLKAYQLPDDAPQAAGQLYNLANDPDEAHNLYDAHPEQAAALERLLKESLASGRSVRSR